MERKGARQKRRAGPREAGCSSAVLPPSFPSSHQATEAGRPLRSQGGGPGLGCGAPTVSAAWPGLGQCRGPRNGAPAGGLAPPPTRPSAGPTGGDQTLVP